MNTNDNVTPSNRILGIKITDEQKLQQQKIRYYSKLFSESCVTKSAFSAVAGFGLGGFWGLFTAALDYGQPSIEQPFNKVTPTSSMKFIDFMKFTGQKCYFMAKSFGFVGMIYAGVECTIEKGRGKHDLYNPILAGCVTGGGLGVMAGPQAAAFGCVGFAAFSGLIDYFLQ